MCVSQWEMTALKVGDFPSQLSLIIPLQNMINKHSHFSGFFPIDYFERWSSCKYASGGIQKPGKKSLI